MLTIHNDRKVFAIREEFSRAFPYLKLEFHARPHTSNGAASPNYIRNSNAEIRDCRTHPNNGDMTISDQMTVGEVQDYFRNVFGLEVEVFCRSGAAWEPADLTAPIAFFGSRGQEAVSPDNRWA